MEHNAWGLSLFADDVRFEVAGKLSLVGIYGSEIIFPQDPPYTLSKLVVHVNYREEANTFKDDLVLKIHFPGTDAPALEHKIARQEIDELPPLKGEPPIDDTSAPRIFSLSMPFVFSPAVFTREGDIRVRMHCGDHVVRLGRAKVRKVRSDESIQFSP